MQNFTTEQARARFSQNFHTISQAKSFIDKIDKNNADSYSGDLTHITINKKEFDDKSCISIVMCVCNRAQQTYFTLQTIKSSKYKDVQIVIVDDSSNLSEQLVLHKLKQTGLHIDYIRLNNERKFWINPCVNYNIGFKFVCGDKVIIQNPEVCHVGDVVKYVADNLSDNKYLVFDVIALRTPADNQLLHASGFKSFNNLVRYTNFHWYQHHKDYNRGFHFLAALSKKDLDAIGGFDIDYCMGVCFDDDALVDMMKFNNISIIPVPHDQFTLFGIHQWHTSTYSGMGSSDLHNRNLLLSKRDYFNKHKEYFKLKGVDDINKIN
jgi:hypothetical protein